MDVAVDFYHENLGENFVQLYDEFLSSPPEYQRYIYHSPTLLLLFQKETRSDPHHTLAYPVPDYWFVVYMGTNGSPLQAEDFRKMLRVMPYHLDKIAFARYAMGKDKRLRFFRTNQLLKHYGIKT